MKRDEDRKMETLFIVDPSVVTGRDGDSRVIYGGTSDIDVEARDTSRTNRVTGDHALEKFLKDFMELLNATGGSTG